MERRQGSEHSDGSYLLNTSSFGRFSTVNLPCKPLLRNNLQSPTRMGEGGHQWFEEAGGGM